MENMINDAEMVNGMSTAAQIEKKLDAIERFREYMMDVYDADWFRDHGSLGTGVGMGWDHVWGGHRLFVEGPNNVNNKTGKWTLAMYKKEDRKMIEIGRDVIGGKTRVSNWEKVACLAHIWIHHELDAMMYELKNDLDDAEWMAIVEESEFLGEGMAKMESVIEDSEKTIKDTIDGIKYLFDDMEDVDWWEIDEDGIKERIADECRLIADKLNEIGQARDNFINDACDYTGCDYGLGDAYCDIPAVDLPGYYGELDSFDATEAFGFILDYLFDDAAADGKLDGVLDFKDTLFHYLVAA